MTPGECGQDRLRALAEEDEANGWGTEPPEASWGGSDEEPDDVQANLMRRTATHIRASPNPTQLEMRILANHGADPRFAFLRGRWKKVWARMRQGQESSMNAEPKQSIMNGLSAYASDSDSGQKSEDEEEPAQHSAHAIQDTSLSSEHDKTEKLKAERRARAKDWARKRKEAQIAQEDQSPNEIDLAGLLNPLNSGKRWTPEHVSTSPDVGTAEIGANEP
ncbi:hypothetical protein RHS01_07214 [Rhizoctonia solani]|uniref:Uncharacterized protein n=1 Tax=Rhizoctonia solani TaxID=456999 RepID=A0A8H7I7T2_9AGAM|nr:hypothetical protein RHS01_07214 [Rhizoctonia solani]